jgi:MYXO-CTERM domain-containing protein
MNTQRLCSLQTLPACLAMALGLLATNAKAANQWFDVNGSTPGYGDVNGLTYSWEEPNWAAASGGGNTTGSWGAGNFARFSGGVSGDAYTVTLNQNESMAGLYNTIAGTTVSINDAGSGLGGLNVAAGDQGFLAVGNLVINAPISGDGGVAPQYSGALCLFGQNTYSGGTAFGYYRYPLTYFNNASSFGSGMLRFFNGSAGGFQPLLAVGGAPITLPNDVFIQTIGQGVNFASAHNTPVISAGAWILGANNLNLRNNGDATAPLTISGRISGTADLGLSSNNNGTIILAGDNSYTGATVVGRGTTAVTLKLGSANTIASSSSLVMAGGILDPGGLRHTMGSTTLALTADSIIDFGAGAADLELANSSGVDWTSGRILNLANWDSAVDALRIGTDPTGLTSAQLAQIEFNGDASSLGAAMLDPNGFIVVPEPSPTALGLLGALGAWLVRRSKLHGGRAVRS